MILRSIEVQGWRCFADPIRVGPFAEGLNVLYAPNGTGKSRLLEALLRAFFDGHRVTGQDFDAIRPWGRALAPEVAVEFACDGSDYRIEKRFLDSPSAMLKRREDGLFVRLAEGEGADQRVRELLRGSAPGRGASKQAHWGYAQVLWASQEGLALEGLSDASVDGIRATLGTQISSPEGHAIERRARELYLQSFTPTGRLKSGQAAPAAVRLEQELAQLRSQASRARERLDERETLSRRVRDIQRERLQAEHAREEQRKLAARLRSEAAGYEKLDSRRETLEARLQAVEGRIEDLARRMDRIAHLRRKRSETERAAETLRSDQGLLLAERSSRAAAVTEAEAQLTRLHAAREAVDEAQRESVAARGFRELSDALQRETDLIEKAIGLENAAAELRDQMAGQPAPTGRELGTIRRALQKRDETRIQLEASLISLEVEPLRDLALDVVSGDEPGERTLPSGEAFQCHGSPEVAIVIRDVARIRARGPAEGVTELRQSLAKAEQKVADLTAPFGTAELEELESLAERRAGLERKLEDAEARLETLLDETTLEDHRQVKARAAAEMEGILREHPLWARERPDPEALAAAAAEQQRRQRSDERIAENQLAAAREAHSSVEKRWQESERALHDASRAIERIDEELGELTADGLSDAERGAKWSAEGREKAAAEADLSDVRDKLAEHAGDPRRDLARAERQMEADASRERELHGQERDAGGRLLQLSVEAPYSALASAEESVARAEEALERERIALAAVALLHQTITEVRAAAVEAVARPVEERATRTLQRIAGGRLGAIRLTERFEPSAVHPPIASGGVALAELSAGEREQLYLSVRLALADVLSGDQRQLLVLDDVLTATDGPRLGRIEEILAEAAQRLQILILTCHPERYRALEGARFLDLEEALRG